MSDKLLFNIKDITVKYGKKTIIDDLNLEINEHEFVAILGPNGCGKSTLIKTLVRVHEPSVGNVYFKGRPIYYENHGFKKVDEVIKDLFNFKKDDPNKKYNSKELGLEIAYVPQLTQFPTQTSVYEFVKMGRFPHTNILGINLDYKKEDAIIKEALNQMGILDLKDKMIDELSGGQKQKTLIAMALAQQTDTIILDEPTNHLDIKAQLEILSLLHKLHHRLHKSIIIVIHDINSGLKYASKVCLMNQGKILAYDKPEVVATAENLMTAFGVETTISLENGKIKISEFKLPDQVLEIEEEDAHKPLTKEELSENNLLIVDHLDDKEKEELMHPEQN